MKPWVLSLAMLASISCRGGGTALRLFSTDWNDDGGRSIEALRQRMGPPPTFADVVVGVTDAKLYGLIPGGTKWSFAHALDSRPILAGSVVVGSGNGEFFSLDVRTGSLLWKRPSGGLALRSAGDDGTLTVLVLDRTEGRGSTLLGLLHDGSSVRQVETDKMLGVPVVVGGLGFVPWGDQYVTVLDFGSGDEVARVTLRDKVSHAWQSGGELFFGEGAAVRFDEKIGLASRGGATRFSLPARELPGTPLFHEPGVRKIGVRARAEDKVRLFGHLASDRGRVALSGAHYYATYFRLALGLTDTGALSWVHHTGSDWVGGAAAQNGLLLCEASGRVVALSARGGGKAWESQFGVPISSCLARAEHIKVEDVPTPALVAQLLSAVQSGDAQLLTALRLLLRELATHEDEHVTEALIDLLTDVRTPPDLAADARQALAARRRGFAPMIRALGKRYDYLGDVLRPPPAAPIAKALFAMKDKSASTPLTEQLFEPALPDEDVREVALALVVLATPAEAPILRRFFSMYRASAESPEMAEAVVHVGHALLRVGDAEGRKLLEEALSDPNTLDGVKGRLRDVMRATDAEQGKSASP